MDLYEREIVPGKTPIDVEIVETDVDLYYHIALSMYFEIEENNEAGRDSVFILPVGPVYQYSRFVALCRQRPVDLSRLHCFFMDEYLDERGRLLPLDHPLSFRGFIRRELLDPMPEQMKLNERQVLFPDPDDPAGYDRRLERLGGEHVSPAWASTATWPSTRRRRPESRPETKSSRPCPRGLFL